MEAGSEQGKWRSITVGRMREMLRAPTIESELRARRVKWLQSIARQPEENRSLLAALTGKFEWDSSIQLSAGGGATSVTNPWLVQFLHELESGGDTAKLRHTARTAGLACNVQLSGVPAV